MRRGVCPMLPRCRGVERECLRARARIIEYAIKIELSYPDKRTPIRAVLRLIAITTPAAHAEKLRHFTRYLNILPAA